MVIYQLRSRSGHRVSFDCTSMKELNDLWLLLQDTGFAVARQNGEAGTSHWRLESRGQWIVGRAGLLILEVDCHQVQGSS